MSWKSPFPAYKQQLDAYRMELVNAIRDCRFAKINADDESYSEAVDALFLILPPELKAMVKKEIRGLEEVIPKETIERILDMKPIDAHFAARKAEMRYSRNEVDRMFSLTVDNLSRAGLLLSSSPRGIGKVGIKRKPRESMDDGNEVQGLEEQ